MMQLMNIAGVVASPNCATLTPWLARPATIEASSSGPDNLESLPICIAALHADSTALTWSQFLRLMVSFSL